MKRKSCIMRMVLAFLCSIALLENAYANTGFARAGVSMYARRGSDDNGHHRHGGWGRHKYYKHHRYYPHDYYYYRKIYHYPFKSYYYYDVYPEKIYYYESEKKAYPSNPDYLPITSVANMASQGVPDAVIISEIERTHSVYYLTSEIITYLKQKNVSGRVIDVMIASAKK